MSDSTLLPTGFQKSHHKLRRSRNDDRECPGSSDPWKIKKSLSLGHEGRTDVLELQLKTEGGAWLDDATAASTICVVLRDALADAIGVHANELGCQVKQSRLESGGTCWSLLIFDRYAAGYSSGADRFLQVALRNARERLECPADCDSVCPKCVLDFDQRFAIDNLDRHAALGILTSQWLDRLKLPEGLAFFGSVSVMEPHPIAESIWRIVGQRPIDGVRLFTSGPKPDWDVAPSPLRELAYRIAGRGVTAEIVVAGTLDGTSVEDRQILASLADHPHIDLRMTGNEPTRAGVGFLLAEVLGKQGMKWAIATETELTFTKDWGRQGSIIVRADATDPSHLEGKIVSAEQIRPDVLSLGDREIEVDTQLNGKIDEFGSCFWELVCSGHHPTASLISASQGHVTHISYSDRYLFSPLSVAIVLEIIRGLKERAGPVRWTNPDLRIRTTLKTGSAESWLPVKVWHDWTADEVRRAVILSALDALGGRSAFELRTNAELGHGRIMEVGFSHGSKLTIRLDQGVGYWRVGHMSDRQLSRFDFHQSPTNQAVHLAELGIPVEGRELPTQLFLKLREE